MPEKPYTLTRRMSSGRKSCLFCEEKIPSGEDILHLDMRLWVVAAYLPKEEEVHLSCGRRFRDEIDGLLGGKRKKAE